MDSNGGRSNLPTELWCEVLSYLSLPDQKQLRLTDQARNRIATPFCFETIRFELGEGSIKRLIQIASHEELAKSVRKLVLRTTQGLPELGGFDAWERSISLPNNDDSDYDGSLMSEEQWEGLSDNSKLAYYWEYEADRKQAQFRVRSLTSHLRFHELGCVRGGWVHPERASTPRKEVSALEQFDEAVAKYTNLNTFKQEPRFDYHRDFRWRQLHFRPDQDTSYDEDEDEDALQLSVVLRALGYAGGFQSNLRSMSFYVSGPAFWGQDRLRHLWQGDGHSSIRQWREFYGDAAAAEEAAFNNEEPHLQRDQYTRQWTIMKHALVHLTHLDCSVSEGDGDGGLFITAKPLFEFLCCGENLKQVRLAFGTLVESSLRPGYEIREHGDGPGELLGQLTTHRPWSKIEELELEIVTDENVLLSFLFSLAPTLRRLALTRVALLPSEGIWDSALSQLASLQLDSLQLFKLYDYTLQGRMRIHYTEGRESVSAEELLLLNPAL